MGKNWGKKPKKNKNKNRSSGKAQAGHPSDASTSADLVPTFDPFSEASSSASDPSSNSAPFVPVLFSSIAGSFPASNSGSKAFIRIKFEDTEFPISQQTVNQAKKKYVLVPVEYDKSLTEWINVTETMKAVYPKTPFEKIVPTDEAIMVVQGLITAFCNLVSSGEEHDYLDCLDNYLLTYPVYDHHSTLAHENAEVKLDKAGEYVDKVKVIIVRDGKLGKPTTTLNKRIEALVDIIFEKIFKGENRLPEWMDLRYALRNKRFAYADCHSCLWGWKKRLTFFVDFNSYIYNRNDNLHCIAYKAITETDLFDKEWRQVLDDPLMAPLKRVLQHKYKDDGDVTSDADAASTSKGKSSQNRLQRRWKVGSDQIRWMKNCYNHLTETLVGEFGLRYYPNIVFPADLPLYMDLRFLNHIVTHFLFPDLWIKLFSNMQKGGYRM